MRLKKYDFWVGLFVMLSLCACLMLVFFVGGKSYKGAGDTYKLNVHFLKVGQLKARAPVKMGGVDVGQVRTIELVDVDGEYKAQVTLDVRSNVVLGAETQASIQTAGLLGVQYVALSEGPSREPALKDGDVIKNGHSAMVLEELITQFGISKAEQSAK